MKGAMSRCCPHKCTLHADQLYNTIGVALTSSANFFINYVVFQVMHLTLYDDISVQPAALICTEFGYSGIAVLMRAF